jgi:fumarate reductase flavoprotein subunit
MGMNTKINRRSFLKGAGLVGVGVFIDGGLSACSTPIEDSETAVEPNSDEIIENTVTDIRLGNPDNIGVLRETNSTEEADVVFVGSGIAGFASAIFVKEQVPEANVIMLESQSGLGGNTNFAEGLGAGPNWEDLAARKQAFSLARTRDFVANPMLFHAKMIEAGDDASWLCGKHGVKLHQYPKAGLQYEGGTGASAIQTLTTDAEGLGVDIRTQSRAVALVLSDEYAVTGIQYEASNGDVVQINAKAIVMATGGMGNNPELLSQYMEPDADKVPAVGLGQNGDGQLMVEKTAHGHAKYQVLDAFFVNMGTLDDHADYHSELGIASCMQQTAFYVNEYGIRFMPEGGWDATDPLTGRPMMLLSQAYAFSIFDTGYVERWEKGEWTFGAWGMQNEEVGRPMVIQPDLETYGSHSWFYKASSIKELGEAIAADVPTFDVEAFEAEVDLYTKYAQSGVDELFAKPADLLWPIGTGPFYAVQACVMAYATHGGIRINTNAQVIDARGKEIDGLYAAGVCTSGWESMRYEGGTGQSSGLWAGLASGRHIVEKKLGGTVPVGGMGDIRIEDIYEVEGAPNLEELKKQSE